MVYLCECQYLANEKRRRGEKSGLPHVKVVLVSSTSSTINILRPSRPPPVKFFPSYSDSQPPFSIQPVDDSP